MVAALRRLGFDKVFDTDFAADLTIMEEGSELSTHREERREAAHDHLLLPRLGHVLEHHHPELIDNLSTCKSPQDMIGAVVKTYYAQKVGIDPQDIVCVSVMPCTAKKYEIQRPDDGCRRLSGCGRLSDHPRAGPADHAGRH